MAMSGTGTRLRQLRLTCRLDQAELAERAQIATGVVSMLETGQQELHGDLAKILGDVLDCTPEFLLADLPERSTTRPWLRAYADASKKAVDRQLADAAFAVEATTTLGLQGLPDVIPTFNGDLANDQDIEDFADHVRAAAGIGESTFVGNVIRAAERLGCLVLPMESELGRHLGMSTRSDEKPVICVTRPSYDPDMFVPGDRQRFTVAHEIGHLGLHGALGPPKTAQEAALVEKQAHLFAGAFLAPGEAMLEELARHRNRVTLQTLAAIKEGWGVAIKALVMRFRNLGVIDADQARSLYKQISARGWNKHEPVIVGTEAAVWLTRAIEKRMTNVPAPFAAASAVVGLGESHFQRWTEWAPTGQEKPAEVVQFRRRSRPPTSRRASPGTVTKLPTPK